MKKTFSTTLDERVLKKMKAVKLRTGVPFNVQIEKAVLEGD